MRTSFIKSNFILGKLNDPLLCEDALVATEDVYCVIDGATSKSSLNFDGVSTGKISSSLIVEVIKKSIGFDSVSSFIDSVNSTYIEFYKEHGILNQVRNNPVDRLNASVAIYNIKLNEVWLIGDCQAIVNQKHVTNRKLIDEILENTRSLHIQIELLNGKSISDIMGDDKSRDFIMPLLQNQQIFQNSHLDSEFAYGVLDGFEIDYKHVKVIKNIGSEIILASDGYPAIFTTLEESEKYLKKVLEEDPLCYRLNKSTKGLVNGQISFDDRAYMKLSF